MALDSCSLSPLRDVFHEARILRESLGLSLQDLSAATRINARYLRAIEEGELGELPGGVFTTSYIRQYAGMIGFNAERLLACCRDTGKSQENRLVLAGDESACPAYPQKPSWLRFLRPTRLASS